MLVSSSLLKLYRQNAPPAKNNNAQLKSVSEGLSNQSNIVRFFFRWWKRVKIIKSAFQPKRPRYPWHQTRIRMNDNKLMIPALLLQLKTDSQCVFCYIYFFILFGWWLKAHTMSSKLEGCPEITMEACFYNTISFTPTVTGCTRLSSYIHCSMYL